MHRRIELARSLFGPAGAIYCEILSNLRAMGHAKRTYSFMDLEEFGAELIESVRRANEIYWKEILQRAHFSAISSALRHDSWLQGALTSAESENFLSFASSVRGLVEACADSYDSLSTVAVTLGDNYAGIRNALNGELDVAYVSADVDDLLTHFQYARRRPGSEFPPEFHAKTVRENLNSLGADQLPHMLELYRHLCTLTHPAEASLAWLVSRPNPTTIAFPGAGDDVAIRQFCEDHQDAISDILMAGVNSDLLLLKTVNAFSLDQLRTPYVDSIEMPDTPAWIRVSKSISAAD